MENNNLNICGYKTIITYEQFEKDVNDKQWIADFKDDKIYLKINKNESLEIKKIAIINAILNIIKAIYNSSEQNESLDWVIARELNEMIDVIKKRYGWDYSTEIIGEINK